MRSFVICLFAALLLALTGCATSQPRVSAESSVSPRPPASAEPIPRESEPIKSPDAVPNLPYVPPVAQPGKVTEPVKGKDGSETGKIDWGAGMIHVTGKAAVDVSNTNTAQAQLMAERAATVDAQRKLLEITKGVRVNGETVVEDLMLKSDLVVTQVDGIVKGARQIGDAKYDKDRGIVSVELILGLYGTDGVSDAIREPSLAPPPQTEKPLSPKTVEALGKYTSVVIQGATGTNGKPSVFPRLLDEQGNVLLDTRNLVGSNATWGQGAIQFVDNINEVLSNPALGSNPLIIQVKQYAGKYLSDYVIPKDQVDWVKVLSEAGKWLLKAGRFLFALL
jgi:hypothetical protein